VRATEVTNSCVSRMPPNRSGPAVGTPTALPARAANQIPPSTGQDPPIPFLHDEPNVGEQQQGSVSSSGLPRPPHRDALESSERRRVGFQSPAVRFVPDVTRIKRVDTDAEGAHSSAEATS